MPIPLPFPSWLAGLARILPKEPTHPAKIHTRISGGFCLYLDCATHTQESSNLTFRESPYMKRAGGWDRGEASPKAAALLPHAKLSISILGGRMQALSRFLLAALVTFTFAIPALAQTTIPAYQASYHNFDVPNSNGTTNPTGINNHRTIVGTYTDSTISTVRGFIFADGHVTPLDAPGATSTNANKVNDNDQVVGNFADSAGATHAFLYQNGSFTVFDFPGATATLANDINNSGVVVGEYDNPDFSVHGFVRMPDGTVTTFDDPNFAGQPAVGNNDLQHIAGPNYLFADGTFTTYFVPGSFTTQGHDLNNQDQIVGVYAGPNTGSADGFVRNSNNSYFDVRFPNSDETLAEGINDKGVVVGSWASFHGSGGSGGFIAIPKGQ